MGCEARNRVMPYALFSLSLIHPVGYFLFLVWMGQVLFLLESTL